MQISLNYIDILLLIIFIILYIFGSYHSFNYLHIHTLSIYLYTIFIICFLIGIALIYYNNHYIGILYSIILIFQLKHIYIDSFTTATTNPITTKPLYKQSSILNINPDDDRFKVDDIKIKEILRKIQAELEFDSTKTELAKNVIIDIYKRYYDNDILHKLNVINDDSKAYIAQYELLYKSPTNSSDPSNPSNTKIDYDIKMKQILDSSTKFGTTVLHPNLE